MQAILNKRVSKIALFYDLVFVYMISKTTEISLLIHGWFKLSLLIAMV